MTPTPAPLLDVRGLKKYFPIAKGLLRRVSGQVRAVDDVSFTVNEGALNATNSALTQSGEKEPPAGDCPSAGPEAR